MLRCCFILLKGFISNTDLRHVSFGHSVMFINNKEPSNESSRCNSLCSNVSRQSIVSYLSGSVNKLMGLFNFFLWSVGLKVAGWSCSFWYPFYCKWGLVLKITPPNSTLKPPFFQTFHLPGKYLCVATYYILYYKMVLKYFIIVQWNSLKYYCFCSEVGSSVYLYAPK